jgi:hypothetical protein
MEPEGSLSYSQHRATGLCLQPDDSEALIFTSKGTGTEGNAEKTKHMLISPECREKL